VVAQARGLRTSQTRPFPRLRSVEETEASFIVRDADGQALAGGAPHHAHLLTRDEARRIARQHRQVAGAAGRFAAVKRGRDEVAAVHSRCARHVGLCSNCGRIAASR
jgi:hypothetical protein